MCLLTARRSTNASVSAMLIDEGGLFLAALVNRGGCGIRLATGVFFWISTKQKWLITHDLCKPSPPGIKLNTCSSSCDMDM